MFISHFTPLFTFQFMFQFIFELNSQFICQFMLQLMSHCTSKFRSNFRLKSFLPLSALNWLIEVGLNWNFYKSQIYEDDDAALLMLTRQKVLNSISGRWKCLYYQSRNLWFVLRRGKNLEKMEIVKKLENIYMQNSGFLRNYLHRFYLLIENNIQSVVDTSSHS